MVLYIYILIITFKTSLGVVFILSKTSLGVVCIWFFILLLGTFNFTNPFHRSKHFPLVPHTTITVLMVVSGINIRDTRRKGSRTPRAHIPSRPTTREGEFCLASDLRVAHRPHGDPHCPQPLRTRKGASPRSTPRAPPRPPSSCPGRSALPV
ncbi:hypothetical protein BDA96_01G289700 [Sorghum bicolor]|uniref:Uncharacterized protein n=1 Tax=Sorghum bicolor TaxID=4558 RepID=A0A921S3G1_SORBI|nr:hypothetical protein BDA96_01G289700 [Sorghum bicolor]KAG0549847.1 hypothetical protein BDA96_01G289700 [Sorghum bicolor]